MSLPFRQTTNLLIDAEPKLRPMESPEDRGSTAAGTKTDTTSSEPPLNEQNPEGHTTIDTPYGRLLINSHITMLKKTQIWTSDPTEDPQTGLIKTWPMEGWNFITLDETQSFAIFAHDSDWRFALLDLLKGTLIKDQNSFSPQFQLEERSLSGGCEDLFHCRKTGLKLVLLPE